MDSIIIEGALKDTVIALDDIGDELRSINDTLGEQLQTQRERKVYAVLQSASIIYASAHSLFSFTEAVGRANNLRLEAEKLFEFED